jgi:hypothetical protein
MAEWEKAAVIDQPIATEDWQNAPVVGVAEMSPEPEITPEEAGGQVDESFIYAVQNKVSLNQARQIVSYKKMMERFPQPKPEFDIFATGEISKRLEVSDQHRVRQHIDNLNSMSNPDRTDFIKMLKLGNFFGVLPYLSNEGYLKVFGIENDVGDLAAATEAANYVANQAKMSDPAYWNYLTADLLRTVVEFESIPIKGGGALRGAAKFAAQEALQFPSESKTWGELTKEKAISVPKAALVGAVVGKTGEWIKNPLVRAPILATGFAGMSYADAKAMGMTNEEALEAAKKSAITIFGFEALNMAEKIFVGKSGDDARMITKAARKWDSTRPEPILTNMSDKEITDSVKTATTPEIQPTIGKEAAKPAEPTKLPTVDELLAKSGISREQLESAQLNKGQPWADEIIAKVEAQLPPPSEFSAPEMKPLWDKLKLTYHELGTARETAGKLVEPVVSAGITPEHRELMKTALEESKEVVPIVQAEIGEERGKIAGAIKPKIRSMQEKGLPTEEAIKRSIPPGPLAKYTQRFPSIRDKLPPEVLESYFASISASETLRPFQVRNVGDAFTKFIDGSYLTLTEVGYLAKHFEGIAPEIAAAAKARVPMGDKVWQTVKEIINIPYTTLTNIWDMSGLGRQGRFLMQRHPELAKDFAEKYVKSFFSEKTTERIVKEYQSSPNLERAIAVGKLQITELPSFYEPISALEEKQIAIPLLERIPLVGKYVIRPTARSFTASLNWYRMAIVDRAISAADRMGAPLTDAQLKTLCGNVNDMSGRSSIHKSLKEIAPFINALFAPRFAISRAKLIGKVYQPDVAIGWGSLIATNLLIMGLIKMLHPDTEIEADLRAADGGKVKIDETRIDLWAGELPYVRSLMRLSTGQTKTASGHIIPTDYGREFFNILRSRENPLFSLITDALLGKNYIGEEFGAPPRGKAGEILTKRGVPEWMQGMSKEAWNRMGPLTMQDVVDTFVEEGVGMAITSGILSGTGIGVQTYPEMAATTLAKYKDQIAQQEQGKNWQDLSVREVAQLTRKYSSDLQTFGRKAKVERAETIDYDYVGKLVEDEKKAGRRVAKMLSPEAQANLKELGIALGLSRKSGDWIMNDQRYEEYQSLTAEYLGKRLDMQVNKPNWSKMSDDRKTEIINRLVADAKERARDKIMRKANRE